MLYRLWDIDIGHMYGAFNNEEEALTFTRALVSSQGIGIAEELCLTCEFGDGRFTPPLSGDALLQKAGLSLSLSEEPELGPGQVFASQGTSLRARLPGKALAAAGTAGKRRSAPGARDGHHRAQPRDKKKA